MVSDENKESKEKKGKKWKIEENSNPREDDLKPLGGFINISFYEGKGKFGSHTRKLPRCLRLTFCHVAHILWASALRAGGKPFTNCTVGDCSFLFFNFLFFSVLTIEIWNKDGVKYGKNKVNSKQKLRNPMRFLCIFIPIA